MSKKNQNLENKKKNKRRRSTSRTVKAFLNSKFDNMPLYDKSNCSPPVIQLRSKLCITFSIYLAVMKLGLINFAL